ncbi:MAG: aromatic ring-hydroxylating dioxygenase subunit alpha, partial [SAR202 cluster bacterium]|nr:aromatic ring-hydroxylating dioxygenase subunit alpha [SAR202 cluster bacterium]
MTTSAKTFLQGYVDEKRGLVSREVYVNEEIYKLEQERVFARVWLFVGHESQIPKPGDYFVGRMGEESVIMTRDRQD